MARVKGKGLPGLRGGRGDLHVRLRVWVPTRLSGADKKLLEHLWKNDVRPGRRLKITEVAPWAGTITHRVPQKMSARAIACNA